MHKRCVLYSKGTYYISIPKEIADLWGLKKGDELMIEYSESELKMRKVDSFRPASDLLKKKAKNKVYTIGYEGKSIEEFIEELQNNRIERVIDVREYPLSRKRGFSKKSLQENLSKAGIDYIPLTALGSPRELRQDLRSRQLSFSEFADLYKNYLLKDLNAIRNLEIHASSKTSAIMCFEADWRRCHRSILAEFLERDGFEVIHL
ncbi:MAG: DUF488 family protein [Archaeoglobaceae archaeon]